jgi:LuxR family transcriptional regulator, maltose regulon positive regulatory protein
MSSEINPERSMEGHLSQAGPARGVHRGQSKRPALPMDLLPRPRIVECLERDPHVPVLLVVGPAGIGKTTAVAEWLSTIQQPACWLNLDREQFDTSRFAVQVVEAVRDVFPEFGHRTIRLLRTAKSKPRTVGLALAEDLESLGERLILVLDDFDAQEGDDVSAVMSELLRHPLAPAQVVVISRRDPKMSMTRMRGRGKVLDLRISDLRFTFEETRGFLQGALGYELDPKVIGLLQERTGGWVAALRLAAMSLRTSQVPDQWFRQFTGATYRHVMDFLADEVIAHEPETHQRLLLLSSLFDRICEAMVGAIEGTEDGDEKLGAALESFSRRGLLEEEYEDGEVWYGLHPLLRGTLRHRISQVLAPQELRRVHSRASDWFSTNGFVGDAIAHALTAGREDWAADLIERYRLEYLSRERWREVADWLDMLPGDLLDSRVALVVTKLRVDIYRGTRAGARASLLSVKDRIDREVRATERELSEPLEAELELLDLLTTVPQDEPQDVCALAERVLDRLPQDDPLGRGLAAMSWSAAMYAMGKGEEALARMGELLASEPPGGGIFSCRLLRAEAIIHLLQGNLLASQHLLEHVARVARQRGLDLEAQWARLGLGILAYERNDLAEAERFFGGILESRGDLHFACVHEAIVGMTLVGNARGDDDLVEASLDGLTQWNLDHEIYGNLVMVDSLRVRCFFMNGIAVETERWASLAAAKVNVSPLWSENPLMTQAKLLVAHGTRASVEAALRSLGSLERRAQAIRDQRRMIEILLLRAIALDALGSAEEAAESMARSLKLVGTQPFVRTFLDVGFDIRPLLERVSARPHPPANLEMISAIVGLNNGRSGTVDVAQADVRDRSRQQLYEVLTRRETEILLCLRDHLTNQEIADRLYISPLTVKRHASNIYQKLGVGSRRQALARATELGYLR